MRLPGSIADSATADGCPRRGEAFRAPALHLHVTGPVGARRVGDLVAYFLGAHWGRAEAVSIALRR